MGNLIAPCMRGLDITLRQVGVLMLFLKTMNVQVTVLRDGKTGEISSAHLVVGDLLLFHTGDILPVDGILIRGTDIKCAPRLVSPLLCFFREHRNVSAISEGEQARGQLQQKGSQDIGPGRKMGEEVKRGGDVGCLSTLSTYVIQRASSLGGVL